MSLALYEEATFSLDNRGILCIPFAERLVKGNGGHCCLVSVWTSLSAYSLTWVYRKGRLRILVFDPVV